MKKLILLLPLSLFLNGCALFEKPSVPATDISFNPKTQALKVVSPKDVTIQSVTISQSPTNFNMTVIGYSSTNNAAIVGTVVAAQASVASNAAVTINTLANLASQAAVNAVK